MRDTKETNPITTAKEKLEETLTYFMDVINAFDASDGMLTLLTEMNPKDLEEPQYRAIYGTLQVLNAISRLQIAERNANGYVNNHSLKIA